MRWVKLSEVALIKARIGWQGLTRAEYKNEGDYLLITGIDFKNGLIDFNSCHFVTKDRYDQDKNIQIESNDILVTKDGTLGKVAYIYELPKPATLNSGVFVVRIMNDKILPRFLFHYLNSSYLMNYAKSRITGGTIKHLNQNIMVDVPIPIPPLNIQKEIIEKLDKFDALINDISIGLPAEIEARKIQYDYYRDKLLTFKELKTA